MSHSGLLHDFVDVIYPSACAGCAQPLVSQEDIFCTYCLSELPKTDFHKLPENPVVNAFKGRCLLQKASAYLHFQKGGMVQSAMHRFKYKKEREVGEFLGKLMARELQQDGFFADMDLVIPIPLHEKKEKIRGYNQSAVLAEPIAEYADLELCSDNLRRSTFSQTQTKKSRFARWLNVERIFEVARPHELKNKHILLIDDVITTGATVEACANQLLSLPGVQVSLLTLAYAK